MSMKTTLFSDIGIYTITYYINLKYNLHGMNLLVHWNIKYKQIYAVYHTMIMLTKSAQQDVWSWLCFPSLSASAQSVTLKCFPCRCGYSSLLNITWKLYLPMGHFYVTLCRPWSKVKVTYFTESPLCCLMNSQSWSAHTCLRRGSRDLK